MSILVGLHAFLGEAGALAFFLVFISLLSPSEASIRRARVAACWGVIFLVGSWMIGGWHYLTDYALVVKPVIKAGPFPWAHLVMTETKEHVFLFLPFLAVLTWGLIKRYQGELVENRNARTAVLVLAVFIVLIAFAMAGMGFIISSGYRAALEASAL